MSDTYTDYHHHQFDRQFSLPLPMPSPTSCWYPQRQDGRSDYMLPQLQTDQPQPPTYWDTSWQPPQQHQQPPQPYHQPPQHYQQPLQPQYTNHHQHDRARSYQRDRPSLPPLPIIKPTSCWGPPRQRDHFGPPQFDLHQSPPQNPYVGYHSGLPEYQSMPPPYQPPSSPTCWDPPGLRAPQGYTVYDQPIPADCPLPCTMDSGCLLRPYLHHAQSSNSLPIAAVVPPPPAMLSPPCSPDIDGEEEALLDEEEKMVFDRATDI